jgi:hypothetical protein
MADKQIWTNLDGVKLGILRNWRENPLTTAQRLALGVTLGLDNSGIPVFDTDMSILFVWNGSMWVGGAGIEVDPVFAAWLAGPPNVSEFNNDADYITSDDAVALAIAL